MKWWSALPIAVLILCFFWLYVHPRTDIWNRHVSEQDARAAARRDVEDELNRQYREHALTAAQRIKQNGLAGAADVINHDLKTADQQYEAAQRALHPQPPQQTFSPSQVQPVQTQIRAPEPPAPHIYNSYLGSWINVPPHPLDQWIPVRISLSIGDDSTLKLREWGACTPEQCDWGYADEIRKQKKSLTIPQFFLLRAHWTKTFLSIDQDLEFDPRMNQAHVITTVTFTDNTGRLPSVTSFDFGHVSE